MAFQEFCKIYKRTFLNIVLIFLEQFFLEDHLRVISDKDYFNPEMNNVPKWSDMNPFVIKLP